MDQSNIPTIAANHNGWTEARKTAFLEHLAACGNDALFARGWDAALVLARTASAEVLACRALDGVEEEVWYRGEVVGRRRRYDTRLLLAHMARLDALVGNERASEDADRFDELLALVGGATPHPDLAVDDDGLPVSRARMVELVMSVADAIAADEAAENGVEDFTPDPAAPFRAATEAAAGWDAWRDEAHATVDRLLGEQGAWTPSTLSTLSTSPLADGLADGQPAASG